MSILSFFFFGCTVKQLNINYKVREHSAGLVPAILAVGRQEVESRTVAVRRLGEQGQKVLPLDQAVALVAQEATPPDLR